MSILGYVRISSKDQNSNRQYELLKNKADKIFEDKDTGKNLDRPGLKKLLKYIREDDVLVVTELDRLGRNNKELTMIMDLIHSKGCTIEILNLPSLVSVKNKNLRMLLNNLIVEIYKYQAEDERLKIRERQQQGIEIAKREGKFKGRQPRFQSNDPRLLHAFKLYQEGKTDRDVESLTGINSRTFRRYRKKYNIYRN